MTDTAGGWRAGRRRPPMWSMLTVGALLTMVFVTYEDGPAWVPVDALLVTVLALAVLASRPTVALGIAALVGVATALAVTVAVPPWSVALDTAVVVISYLAGHRTRRTGPALVVFAVGALFVIPINALAPQTWSSGLLILTLAVITPWLVGRYIRQQAELVAATADRVRLAERTRIAQEMHDSLGHELSLLTIRAGALEMATDVAETRVAIGELRAGAGAATDRLAEIVGLLRDDEPASLAPVTSGINDLVARAAAAGMAVSLRWQGQQGLPPVAGRAAHRVVQEALTNAGKHAPGAAVTVNVAVEDTATVINVTNGPSRDASRRATGGGTGLAGLRERVYLCGGTLRAGPLDGGFEVVAQLPHQSLP